MTETTYVAIDGRAWHIVKAWQLDTNGFKAVAQTLCERWISPEFEAEQAWGRECKRCARILAAGEMNKAS